MEGDHGLGHGFAGVIGVEAAEKRLSLGEQIWEPGWIGACTGGGEAVCGGKQGVTTEGIDGGLAQDAGFERCVWPWLAAGRDGEGAEVLAGAWGHAAPREGADAAQFGTDGLAVGVTEEEDGVGSRVGVETAGLDERVQQCGGQSPLLDQVTTDLDITMLAEIVTGPILK